MGSALAIWSDKHRDAKGSWTTDFAKSQFVSYLFNLLYLITYLSYLIIFCGFFMKDLVTALVTRRDWEVGIGPSIPRSSLGMARALDEGFSSSSSRTDLLVSDMQSASLTQQAEL